MQGDINTMHVMCNVMITT